MLETSKDKSIYLLLMAGLSLVTVAVVVIVFRQTRNLAGPMSRDENNQVEGLLPNKEEGLLDGIDQQAEASFPASDSPSWSGAIAGGSH